MRPGFIVMFEPRCANIIQLTSVEYGEVVQAFVLKGADELLAKRIGLWRTNGRFNDLDVVAFEESLHPLFSI